MTRRRGELSEEDRHLWSQVAATVAPLPRRAPAADPPRRDVAAGPAPSSAPPPCRAVLRPAPPPGPAWEADLAPDALPSGLAGLDGARARRLLRGELAPDARIDLHGLGQETAHRALLDAVARSQARGDRVLLVITGKGAPGRESVLRRLAPRWLAEPGSRRLIAALAPAHRRHGGEGAFYVYLRRRRPE